jgi:hypothetical protein
MVKHMIPKLYKLESLPEFQRFQEANPDNKIDEIQTAIMFGRAIHWLAIIDILWPDYNILNYYSVEVKYLAYNDPDRGLIPSEFYDHLAHVIYEFWKIQLEDLFPEGNWSVNIRNDPELTVDAIIPPLRQQKIHPSREEELVLEPILASMSRKAGHPLTVPFLLERWENFVSEVEEGYDDSIYEYTNDLSVRDLIQVIVDNSPKSFHDKLVGALRIWDERFKKATEGLKRPVLPNREKSQAWWWFRVPIKSGSELKKDL